MSVRILRVIEGVLTDDASIPFSRKYCKIVLNERYRQVLKSRRDFIQKYIFVDGNRQGILDLGGWLFGQSQKVKRR